MLQRPTLDSLRPESSQRSKKNFLFQQNENFLRKIADLSYNVLSLPSQCVLLSTVIYLATIAAISYYVDTYGSIPDSYFSNKKNIPNQYFVKLGWGWTLSLLTIFLLLTNYVKSGGGFKDILKGFVRMACNTFCWYISVSIFDLIHETSGFCGKDFALDLSKCKPEMVRRVDISGHTFLLLFNILVILEETKVYRWFSEPVSKNVARSFKSIENLRRLYSNFHWFINISIILIVALFLLWHVMLVSTALYFHDLLQKVLGALFAIFGWIIYYKILFCIFRILPC